MANLLPTLNDHDYRNWVKGGLGLKFAREGIENFVERKIDKFHKDVLNSLSAQCNNCSTKNIIQCKHNNNFCKFSKHKCLVHDPRDPNKNSRPCLNSVCNIIRDEIVNKHRFHGPSWSNTDSCRWCREPWQLATCYMAAGYAASNSASETDFPGLLAVIINNKVFETEVTDNLTNKNNMFCKARNAHNAILHKPDMRLSDTELAGYIATLDAMLSDSKCLAVHPSAIQARTLLQQLLHDTLNVTTVDAEEIKALRVIEEKKKMVLITIDDKEASSRIALQNTFHTLKGSLKQERKKAGTEIQKTARKRKLEATAAIQSSSKNATYALKAERDKAIVAIETKEVSSVAAVYKAEDEATRRFKSASAESHDQNKKALKKELLSIYQNGEHLSFSLGPVATDEDKHIDELYVTPNMNLVDHQKAKDEGKPVKNYQDIFKSKNENIYVVGEAGTGKTSLCQKMVSTWCQINTTQIENMSKSQQAMAQFDYLFYISLRDVISNNNIDEMIVHHLLPNKPNLHDPLSRVLEEENCLIILDGLDEWTTESKTATSVNRGLPGRDAVKKCTVLTTTRPWKLETLHLKSSQIDMKIELLGIDETSTEKLIKGMINHLNDMFHCQNTYENCISELNDKQLVKLMTIPVILKQIVCLWHAGKKLGKNKNAIYSQMLELLFELSQIRLINDSFFQQKKEEWMKSSIKLPSYFDDNETCQDFKPLLFALAELAFHTLLSDDQESSLVFKSTKAGCHNLNQEEVNICLKIGILSQNKILIDCTSQFKKVSFLHKTYQEFLAAMYVSLKKSQAGLSRL